MVRPNLMLFIIFSIQIYVLWLPQMFKHTQKWSSYYTSTYIAPTLHLINSTWTILEPKKTHPVGNHLPNNMCVVPCWIHRVCQCFYQLIIFNLGSMAQLLLAPKFNQRLWRFTRLGKSLTGQAPLWKGTPAIGSFCWMMAAYFRGVLTPSTVCAH